MRKFDVFLIRYNRSMTSVATNDCEIQHSGAPFLLKQIEESLS